MQTEVNSVRVSIPGGNSSLASTRNLEVDR